MFFSSLSILLLLAGGAAAQNNTIKGKVRSDNGVTVNNAIVELRQTGGGITTGQTVTRNDGDFAFSGLSSAEYELSVTIAGYEPVVQLARFSHMDRMDFREVLNVEIVIL